MSKINNRNYQLNLAYADGDLRKPKHDEIMHWLDAWVHESDNLFKLIDSRFNRRAAITRGVLDDDSENAYRAKGAHERSQLQIYLDADSKPSKAEVDTAWPDEPRRVARYLDSQWEWPLKGDRGMPVGFCDLYAAYEVGDTLRKVKESVWTVKAPDPKAKGFFALRRPEFTYLQTREKWDHSTKRVSVFFEVKTEITSVGELMRQLQLYRSCATIRDCESALMVVVAPPNDEAADVCGRHDVRFLEYRPN